MRREPVYQFQETQEDAMGWVWVVLLAGPIATLLFIYVAPAIEMLLLGWAGTVCGILLLLVERKVTSYTQAVSYNEIDRTENQARGCAWSIVSIVLAAAAILFLLWLGSALGMPLGF